MTQSSFDKHQRATLKSIDSKKLTFAHSFQPIYYFLRIFGFMPFSIVHDLNGAIKTARVRTIDFLWFIISMAVYLLSAFHFLISNQHLHTAGTSILLANCTRSILTISKLFHCLCIGIDMCNRFKIVGILKKINSFDEKVSSSESYLSLIVFLVVKNFEKFTFFECRWRPLGFISIMEWSVVALSFVAS